MYNLVNEGADSITGQSVVRRQAFKFGDGLGEQRRTGLDNDLIQINVHRIEHGNRIRDLQQGLGLVDINGTNADGLRLTISSLLEPGLHARRFKYQLLDPVDPPYAAFRFFYRPYKFLEDQRIVRLREPISPCSSVSSIVSQSSFNESTHVPVEERPEGIKEIENPLPNSPKREEGSLSPDTARGAESSREGRVTNAIKASDSFTHMPSSDSDDSLSARIKDSVEDLRSAVPRSPKSSHSLKDSTEGGCKIDIEDTLSPTPSSKSARQHLKKKLTVDTHGVDFDLGRKKRPLSSFNSAGVFRKAMIPQTAPAAVTEFGPTMENKVALRTTSAERDWKKPTGFLGRRIASKKTA
ncbi:uncharacterized protein Z518_04149 [Rhinocladiella mackenziei CBS 650.93]|uniref:Uncharacterized protein n=1 Tax=Rhinocladiella mackenziei CBS 650.93 TaxID=1442369 RepID=A0A0D2JAN5_9EURO|nr:uncharacterized protein Z518_04149 [Rhinocladiella mackenziei CBS 650.93]KIX06175.1 hypothetical protein Z518_04149 [Rhinocladiella mackenziei CBS 650.93]